MPHKFLLTIAALLSGWRCLEIFPHTTPPSMKGHVLQMFEDEIGYSSLFTQGALEGGSSNVYQQCCPWTGIEFQCLLLSLGS